MENINLDEGNRIIKIYKDFLYFIGNEYNLITQKELLGYTKETMYELLIVLRNKVFSSSKDKILEYINKFVERFKSELNIKELELINNFSKAVLSDFFIVSFNKDYTIFFDIKQDKPYGVLGVTESISNILSVNIMTKTLILPYNNKIISDGLFQSQNIHFGGSIVMSFKEDFEKAKLKYGGIILNLNEKIKLKSKDEQELGMLEYYLNSESRMREYYDEICDLWNKTEEHKVVYYLGRGKLSSKKAKKRFEELGVSGVFVGIFEDTVIASASSENELNELLDKIIPKNKKNWIYVFKIGKKRD